MQLTRRTNGKLECYRPFDADPDAECEEYCFYGFPQPWPENEGLPLACDDIKGSDDPKHFCARAMAIHEGIGCTFV